MAYVECKVWSFDKELEEEDERYEAMKEGLADHCKVEALIDTTSNFNIISKRIVNRLRLKYNRKLTANQKKLKGIVGYVSCLDLSFQDELMSGNDEVLNDFEVVKKPKADLILGLPWLWLRESVIDIHNNKFSIYGRFVPLCEPSVED